MRAVMASLLLLACLAGCGQKGALYMPGHAPKSQIPRAPAAHPSTTPAPPAPPAVTPPPAEPSPAAPQP